MLEDIRQRESPRIGTGHYQNHNPNPRGNVSFVIKKDISRKKSWIGKIRTKKRIDLGDVAFGEEGFKSSMCITTEKYENEQIFYSRYSFHMSPN